MIDRSFQIPVFLLLISLSFIVLPSNASGSGYGFEESDGSYRIYDISKDPYESYNVADKDDYSSYISLFEGRKEYWQALTVDTNVPDDSSKSKAWSECKSVCPWLTTDEAPLTVEQKYSYSDAPHIVYVLVDDMGYNDLGLKSTYLSWTTPNLDRLANEGILLDSYYTNEVCAPSRASLLTGRYVLRLGVYTNDAELPLSEITMAQEMKSAGYRTYAVGKWHLGQSTSNHFPTQRGFDYFYGFVNGRSSYYEKTYGSWKDLFEGDTIVTDETALDTSYHSAYLFESKVEEAIASHATNYADTPMFMYYAMQLVHDPWTAPAEYLSRCTSDVEDALVSDDATADSTYQLQNYCAMMVMMDEAIGNLTCALTNNGMGDNTILIIAGDNGGESSMSGSSYPFKGHKGSVLRGGVSNHAIIHSNLIPSTSRGVTYSENVHITDWLPTLMGLATNKQWTGSYSGADLDGVDFWDAMLNNEASSREEMVFSSYDDSFAMQYGEVKYLYNFDDALIDPPSTIFEEDLDPEGSRMTCTDPSLVESNTMMKIAKSAMKALASSSPSTLRLMLTSLFLFVFVAALTIIAFALMASFRKDRIAADGMNDMDLYATYKDDVEVDAETRTLL
jgi:arylsulfatase A-like enzyme